MARLGYALLLLLFFPFISLAADITELPLGTSGARAFVVPETFSEDPFIIADDLEYADLSSELLYYFDDRREETPESLLTRDDFTPTEGRVAWGFQDAACWFKFDYRADVSVPKELNLKVLVTGFPMTVRSGDKGTVYIYLDYPAGILSHARLYSAEIFRQKANVRLALNALILGMNLALILYNIIIFIWTKESVFLSFVLYLLTFTLHIYLREDYISSLLPFFRDYYFSIPPFVFAVLFTQSFLHTKQQTPIIHRIFQVFLVFGIIFSVTNIIGFRHIHFFQLVQSMYKAAIATLAVILGMILWMRKNWTGFLYLISWLPIIASNFILQFEQLGMLQTNGPVFYFIVREGLYASGIFQAILLSITLADRINLFRTAERDARREMESLKELDQKKTDFLMNVSHEFRTPLTLILGTVGNIRAGRYGSTLSSTHQAFRVLSRNASRLLFMINNLLNATLLDVKRRTYRMEPVSPDRYLRFLVSEFESLALMKDIDLVYENPHGALPLISADLELLELIFLNLFSNAFKCTPPGGRISVRLEASSDVCAVTMHNTGREIEPGELSRIFDRFYQAQDHPHSKYEGIGIGLSLVRDSVDELGGEIAVRNHPDGGVEFSLTLPRAGERERERDRDRPFEPHYLGILKDSLGREDDEAPDTDPSPDAGQVPEILVVEDNEDLRAFLLSELRSSFRVRSAGNGREALDAILAGYRPRMIVCDIMMPEMDGYEFFREMRDKGFTDIPFLFLTARASADEKLQALEGGVIDYLYKPFLPQELSSKVRNIIDINRESVSRYKRDLKKRILETLEADEYQDRQMSGTVDFEEFAGEHGLSKRERDVVLQLLQGLQDKEIAGNLDIAISTVSNTLHRVYRKTGISGRMDLFRYLTVSRDR